jgi:hypothetical protein
MKIVRNKINKVMMMICQSKQSKSINYNYILFNIQIFIYFNDLNKNKYIDKLI